MKALGRLQIFAASIDVVLGKKENESEAIFTPFKFASWNR